MSIESDAETYIRLNYRSMITQRIFSEGFPGDDHLADPTNIGEIDEVSILGVENSNGHLTVNFSFQTTADLEYSDQSGHENRDLRVSNQLWGEVDPEEYLNENPNVVADNPRAFRFDRIGGSIELL